MEFRFKRKYTGFFFVAILLHSIVLGLYFLLPNSLYINAQSKQTIFFLALINCELILCLYLGLFRKKYFVYHDNILIKKALASSTVIHYKDIISIKEKPNDSIILGMGIRPSFNIVYKQNLKTKKITVRTDNTKLMLDVLKKELKIASFK